MHKVKTAARSEAWRTDDEEYGWARYNPFVRHRNANRRKAGLAKSSTGGLKSNGINNTDQPYDHFNGATSENDRGLNVTEGNKDAEKSSNGLSGNSNVTGTTQAGSEDGPRNRKKQGKISRLLHLKNREEDGDADLENAGHDSSGKHDKQKFSLWSQIRYSIFNSWLNVLLVFVPVGIALHFVPSVNPIVVFVINFIAIIPLAGTLSYATEEISLRVGETLGGLLNATFGNAVELIVSIIALLQNEITIVQTSLIGSMLSNLLLVMGMCFFFGGINRKRQHFNTTVAQTAASLLALAVAGLIIPTAFDKYTNLPTETDNANVASLDAKFSRATAVLLLVVYLCYLVFQLRTHEDIYSTPSKKVGKTNLFKNQTKGKEGDTNQGLIQGAGVAAGPNAATVNQARTSQDGSSSESEPEEEDREQPTLSWVAAIITLLWSTVLVAVCAEFLVDAINYVVESAGVSRVFIGLILLPIVGNAAEHATALTVACKDKMDLAIGVAVGSSMQIALFVLPFIVIVGWGKGVEAMTLVFDPFDIIVLFVSVLLVNYLISDGESHWLEGMMLMVLYIIIAVAAWFYPNDATNY